MPRSPSRRSRSPEPRRSTHRDARSPSPRYDRSHASSSRRPDERRSARYEDDRARDRDYGRRDDRDVDRDRDRRRDGPSDRERRRSPINDRRRYERDDRRGNGYDDRRRDEHDTRPRDRSRENKPAAVDRPGSGSPAPPSGGASPGPQTAEEIQRKRREALAAWKAQNQKKLDQVKDGKPGSAAPEHVSAPTGKAALPAKPAGAFSLGGLSRIGLPVKGAPAKRAFGEEEEDAPDRKLQKLDLPEVDMKVDTGEEAKIDTIGEDLAAEVVDDGEQKPDLDVEVNGIVTEEKMEVEQAGGEDEEDELEAYMKGISSEVKAVNVEDAKRRGLLGVDDEEDETDTTVVNKQEEDLTKAEALLQLAASKSRKKDLPPPDHSKIKYEPFRKAFYSAPVEVMEMDEEETELVRLEMDGIKIRGKDAPRPVRNWGAFGLPTACLDVIRRNEWAGPTSIQAQAIPAVMSGRDVIGIAKTGSGKTIAFLLPLFRHVKDQRPVTNGEGPIAIIMSPTRELAMQIHKESKPFLAALNLRVSCCVGGSSISEDISNMKKGAEVVVCTPGRMIDLLTANNGRVTNVRRTTYLVLDEADRMFDMGFEPQVMKIINNIRPEAQKVLFSATFPKTMESLARKILVNPLEITVGGRSVVAAEIDQRVEVRDADTKFNRLLEILGELNQKVEGEDEPRTLIFVERQEAADDLFSQLLSRGYVCASLHGGKEQVDREEAIKNFKNGDVPIIVATSIAARGLDVKELRLVINYDAPNHLEDYVHRAGRTGRAGNKGTCITFLSPEQEKLSVDIMRALEASKAFIPDKLKEMAETFLAKIKAGKARVSRSGFAGKGLERIEKKRREKDQAEKHTYGDTSEALSLSSREGAVIPYKAKEANFKAPQASLQGDGDYTFTEIKVDIINGPAPDRIVLPNLMGANGKINMSALPKSTLEAFEKAKAEGRNVDAQRLASVISKLAQSIELTKADKFGLAEAPGGLVKTKDPDATDYHAIFPINDYPQKARWRATEKKQMSMLAEISGASITMRGRFYSPGEEPVLGEEPKLHLVLESNDRDKVQAAIDEVRRVLVEGSMQALNTADRYGGQQAGRYAV